MNSTRLFNQVIKCCSRELTVSPLLKGSRSIKLNGQQQYRTFLFSKPSGKRKPFTPKFSLNDLFFSRHESLLLVAFILFMLMSFPVWDPVYRGIRNSFRLEVERHKFKKQLDEMERALDAAEMAKAAPVDKK